MSLTLVKSTVPICDWTTGIINRKLSFNKTGSLLSKQNQRHLCVGRSRTEVGRF